MNFFDKLNSYDIFAYLPQGLLALAAIDYVYGTSFVVSAKWTVSEGFLIVFSAYIAGHLIASPSSAIIERLIVRKFMSQPSITLLSTKRRSWLLRVAFSDYYTPLSSDIRTKAISKLQLASIDGADGEEVFSFAYSVARKDPFAQSRMAVFLNLYGLCRNICFVAGLASAALFCQIIWHTCFLRAPLETWRLNAGVALLLISFMLFQRYLKFFRLYSVEVFRSFVA